MRVAFLSLLMAGAALSVPAFAQSSAESLRPGGVLPAGLAGPLEPADRLAMSLRMLSQNPYDVGALTQAGESALAVGDANAAISFLARAEELSPSSGRIKASLGGALVLVERPADSFRLFAEAVALGVPEHQLSRDRGLAFDLTGDPRRAQRDYVLALRHGADDETVRRYALSLGMSGEKDQALKQLEPLIRKRDQGAWRARAFVLAMNGDERGAMRIAEQVMTPDMMPTFMTFARRLARLTPAQQAAAVNFGTMPSTDMRMAQASTGTAFRPISEAAFASLDPAPVRAAPAPAAIEDERSRARAKRRRPGRDEVQTALASPRPLPVAVPAPARAPVPATRTEAVPTWSEARISRRVGERIAPVDPKFLPPEARGVSPAGVRAVLQPTLRELPAPTPADRVGSAPMAAVIAARAAASGSAPTAPVVTANPLPAVNVQAIAPTPINPVEAAAPAPVFEIPKAPIVQVAVQVAVQAPVPKIEAAPVQVAVASPPVPVVAAPAPVPVSIAPTAAAVPPPPALAAIAPPPAPGFSEAIVPNSAAPAQTLAAMTVTPLPAQIAPTPLPTTPSLEAVPAQVQGPANPNPVLPAIVAATTPAPAPVEPREAPVAGLGSVLSGLSLEQESAGGPVLSDAEFRRARLAAKRKAEAESGADTEAKLAADAKAKEDAEKLRIAKASPERIWVQVATGSNRSGLSGTLSKLRDQAPDALKGVGGASVPFKATNRVLVGPFKTQTEARAVINKLSKKGLSATSYTSTAGQEVSKLPSR